MRIGAAAAPRWWGIDRHGLSNYLAHLSACGASSVELVVHHGPATRDPSAVHLGRANWEFALDLATQRGLHVDVHNSLDARFQLAQWSTDPAGLRADLHPILDLLSEIEKEQGRPPSFVVHAADGCQRPETATREVLAWLVMELERRGCPTNVCLELRAAVGPDDVRFDRHRERLVAFIDEQRHPLIGLCWDVANEWLSARRAGRELELPIEAPTCLRHVHLHDATAGVLLHAPLGDGGVPWEDALRMLRRVEWSGSVTLEIRYRLAHDDGDPWTVLAESVRRAKSVR